MAAVEAPKLMAIERAGPKGYLRYIFPFQLASDYNPDELLKVLRDSFEATKKRLPILGCEAVPDTESTQGGVLKLQHGNWGTITSRDLRAEGAFPLTYAELKAKHFPVQYFDADLVTRGPVWPTPGQRLPITEIQANFIQGGLILNWNIFHMIGDGKTFQKMLEVWAEECQRVQGLEITSPVVLGPELFDRSRLMKSSGQNAGNFEDHPEYTILPFVPTGAPPKMLSPSHRAEVFYFSPAALAQLKKDAAPALATSKSSDEEVSWISTNDALSALLWHTVMEVQNPLDTLEGDPLSVFNIAIDGRARASPPHPPDMLGCFLEYVAVSMPIRTMLSSKNLSEIAIAIRRAVNGMEKGNNWTDDVIALFEKVPDVNQIVPTAFLDVPGNNCIQTTWAGLEMYKLRWGPMFGDVVDAIRSPSSGVINGLQTVLPTLPLERGGGVEVIVGVEEKSLSRLDENELWNKYATRRAA